MEIKDGLCKAEVRKNLVLAEIGEPLTLPLATLNRSCEFRKEWNRIQKIWHKKKVVCIICGKEFTVSKQRYRYCSLTCSEVGFIVSQKSYRKSPKGKSKIEAYERTPKRRAYKNDWNKKYYLLKKSKNKLSPIKPNTK